MRDRRKHIWAARVLICNVLLYNTAIGNPLYVPQYLTGGTGRNIRHLPCVSRRTGETGVCMFAFTCAKSNGTHLGTCIDRFYFGSCCKIDEEPDVFPQDNTIEDGPLPSARPFLTTPNSIESNDIPEYFPKPKPNLDAKPLESLSTRQTTRITETSTVKILTEAPTKPYKVTSKKPTSSIPLTTTTQATKLSTFQTVQTAIQGRPTISPVLQLSSVETEKPQRPISAIGSSSLSINSSKPRPSSPISPSFSSTLPQHLLSTDTSTIPSIISSSPMKQSIDTTTQKFSQTLITITTPRTIPMTRFPPRNATTTRPFSIITRRPITTTTTTKRIPTTIKTRKPVTVTTKRPSSVVTTTKRPSTVVSTTKRSSVTTVKRTNAPTRRPVTTTPSSVEPTKPSSTFGSSVSTEKLSSSSGIEDIPFGGFKPSTKRPVTDRPTDRSTTTTDRIATTVKTKPTKPSTVATTKKPVTSASTKRPVNATTLTKRPVKPTTSRPTTVTSVKSSDASTTTEKITSRIPVETSTRPRPTSKPSTVKPSFVPSTLPLASSVSFSHPSSLASLPNTTSTSALPSTSSIPLHPSTSSTFSYTVPSISSPLSSSSTASTTHNTTQISSTFSIQPTLQNTTLMNEVLPSKQPDGAEQQITHGSGLVTWSSNSDELVTTKNPEVVSTLEVSSVTTEWTPLTTPDGWIIIQSPTTEKLETELDSTSKPVVTSTEQLSTSVKPTIEEATLESTTKMSTTTTNTPSFSTTTTAQDIFNSLNMSDYKQVCGRRLFPEARIVGGTDSSFGKWPWQVSLRQWRTTTYLHKCGAALLNENWAITAAHCVENLPPSDLLLRIGEYDLANEEEPYGFYERRVQIVASHPQFDPRTFEYDLALLRFYEPLLPFQPNVLPICVPDDDEHYVGHTAYVTGWGRLYEDGPLPTVLQEVSVPVINNTICEAMYRTAGYIEDIPNIFICAGWRKGGYDSCEGDSGGPMVIQRPRDKRWILAGIISWGIGCAEPNQPGVYTRISEFREWINQILQF